MLKLGRRLHWLVESTHAKGCDKNASFQQDFQFLIKWLVISNILLRVYGQVKDRTGSCFFLNPKGVKMSVCLWALHNFMFKCVLQYFDPFCSNPSEKFISKHISNIIGYTYLQPDITTPPPTYDIRVTSLEFCVHLMNFYVGVKLFVLHNDIIHRSCNIGTAAHLLFTKATSSDFQEFLGKVLSHLEFRLIVVLLWNE